MFAFTGEGDVQFSLLELNVYVVFAAISDAFCLSSFASSTGLLVLKPCGKVYFI